MSRGGWAWATLLAAGLVGVGALVVTQMSGVPRPEGSGDVGVLKVFAQRPSGPTRLPVGRKVRLYRPQDITFYLDVEGTGPRFVRIEVEAAGTRAVVFEEKFQAPVHDYLEYILKMGEEMPDEVMLTVVVEAPHMMSAISDFPLQLVGGDTPFWDPAARQPEDVK